MSQETYKLTLEIPLKFAKYILHVFEESGSVVYGFESEDDSFEHWKLEAYGETKEELKYFFDQLDALPNSTLNSEQFEDSLEALPAIDWVSENQKSFQPIHIGRFFIHPSEFDTHAIPEGSIAIKMDAGCAFGTGTHATTSLVLQAIDQFAFPAPEKILDIGCGTAILSIAAAKLWQQPILACDIREKSVTIARKNAVLNEVAEHITCFTSDGTKHQLIQTSAPFDLVFANILAEPLIMLSQEITDVVFSGGHLILSGYLEDQKDKVEAAYIEKGFTLIEHYVEEGWVGAILEKN